MIISPCAMLITPITPKVMASPMAASNRIEPREMPWNTASAPSNQARWLSIFSIADSAAARTSGGAFSSKATSPSSARTAGSRLSDRRSMAAMRSSGVPAASSAAIRAWPMAALTSSTCSAASAARSRASIWAEPYLAASSAAAWRIAGSGLNRRSWASASATAPRTRLLTLTFLAPRRLTAPRSSPLKGSESAYCLPSLIARTRRLSDLRVRRLPLASASSTGTARASPRAAISPTTAMRSE